ncbi:sorbosone dehydrogenase [Paroceanicella profunda]|uniref:Sorbosone dehydrogenase n=1 Tax=Paroceanicella profunda TaxID=2579971 RepID=A0A5B8FG44_9RHOB|nr:GMC oxidoreductase [Paroceanicella profunda]QDL90398.1 sorbosone dehydrogenase [Paroceanicella profunda]
MTPPEPAGPDTPSPAPTPIAGGTDADILVIGGGSAGCVLAARLSEDPALRVVLVEAGRDISAANLPPEIRSRYPGRAYLDPRNTWARLTARLGTHRRYEQARLLGGGSAINALMSNRGAPADYDRWAEMGATGWSWADCLPVFRAIEADRDCDGPLHGRTGPLVLRRPGDDRLSPFVARVMAVLARRGTPHRADQNGPWQDGTFRGVTAVSDAGERQPTSVAWLTPAVRARPNLRVLTGHQALRLTHSGARVTGAELRGPAGGLTLSARLTVLSAGALHTPALMLRSGIGPEEELSRHAVAPLARLPGVGRNLMEHPSIAVACTLPRAMRVRGEGEHHEQGVWRYSSGLPGTPPGDMHGAILSRSGWHSLGRRTGSIFFWVNKSFSRGRVRLASADLLAEPEVDFAMLSDPRDLTRLKDALRAGAAVLGDPGMDGARGTVFPASYTPRVARIAAPGARNALARGLLSGLIDIAGPLRGALVGLVITPGVRLSRLLADDAALTAFVRRNVGGTWHPSGTCRMGAEDDPEAVTDPRGRVRGVPGLRIADASLMPEIPCANTNLPTLMIAERIAGFIRADLAEAPGDARPAARAAG